MDPARKNTTSKPAAKPGGVNNRNDHDAPNSIGSTDDKTDEELMSEAENDNAVKDENDSSNPGNTQPKIVNNENGILENPDRPGETEEGSV